MLHPSKDGVFEDGHYWLKRAKKFSKIGKKLGGGGRPYTSKHLHIMNGSISCLYEVNDFIKTSFLKPNSLIQKN